MAQAEPPNGRLWETWQHRRGLPASESLATSDLTTEWASWPLASPPGAVAPVFGDAHNTAEQAS
jgi:hypothetical protein